MSTPLHSLLDAGQAHDAEYGRALANHQPMALVALARLGADDAHLARYAQQYAQKVGLRPAPAAQSWPLGDEWRPRLGQVKAFALYRDLFRQWLEHEGSAGMLGQILPWLMPGCSASAFHGLIRTAYGLQAGHAGEVADGVAYWACRYLPLGEMPAAPHGSPITDPAVLLRKLGAGESKAGLIAERMADAAHSGVVNAVITPFGIDEQAPERLARAAAYAYAHTGNFTALHLVTSTHAARVVLRYVANDEDLLVPAWRHFWQAYAHGVVAARLKVAVQPLQLRSWREITALALASPDEHVIKLVDSCREEARHYGAVPEAPAAIAVAEPSARPRKPSLQRPSKNALKAAAAAAAAATANAENSDTSLIFRQAASRAVQAAAGP